MMTVNEIYEVFDKNREHWDLWIFDKTGNKQFGYCNDYYRWEDIQDAVKVLPVIKLSPGHSSLFIKVDIPIDSEYQSEERCLMDGYSPVLYREYHENIPSGYYYKEISNGYSFAKVS